MLHGVKFSFPQILQPFLFNSSTKGPCHELDRFLHIIDRSRPRTFWFRFFRVPWPFSQGPGFPSQEANPKNIERFTENQASLRSNDSAPRISPSPRPFPVSKVSLSLSQSSCVSPVDPPDGRWGVRGRAYSQIIRYREKAWLSINHSILCWRTFLHF